MTQTNPKPNDSSNSPSVDNITPNQENGAEKDIREEENQDKKIVIATHITPHSTPPTQKPLPKVNVSQPYGRGNANAPTSKKADQGISRWWQKLSLQRKAAVAATALGVLPAVIVGGIALGVASNSLNKQVENNLKTETRDQVESLRGFLRNQYSNLSVLADREIWTHSKVRDGISAKEKNDALDNVIKEYPAFKQLAVLNTKGEVISFAGQGDSVNLPKSAPVQTVLKTGKPVVSFISGSDALEIAVPMKDNQNGSLLGVVSGKIAIAQLTSILGYQSEMEEDQGNREFYYLVNSEGNIIASNRTEDIGAEISAEFPKLVKLQQKEPTNNFLITRESHGQAPSVVSYRSANLLEDSVNLDWDLILVKGADQVYAPIKSLKLGLTLATLLTLGLAALTAALVAKPLTQPIRRIAQAVNKMGQGDLDIELPVTGEDEIGVLGKNINSMSHKLKNLLREQELSLEQSKLLTNIANRLHLETESHDSLFGETSEQIRQLLNLDRVIVYRLKDDQGGYVAYEALGENKTSALSDNLSDVFSDSDLLDAYQQGKVTVTDDVLAETPEPEYLTLIERLQIRGQIIAPLFNEGQLFGFLILHHCHQPYHWSEPEINFVSQLTEQLSQTLDRISFQQQRKEDAQRASSLKDTTLAIAGALTSHEVFNVAVESTRRAIKADRMIVYCFNPDWSGTIIAESVHPDYPQALDANINDPCFAQKYIEKYKRGRVKAIPDVYQAGLSDCHLQQLEPIKVRANLVVSIVVEGELLGLLIAHQCSGPRAWTQGEIDFMSQVSTQVGLALERTDLLAKQRKAEEEQRSAREKLQKRALELLMQVDPVSQGDLTIRAQVTEDEIGTIADSYNATIESLRKIVTQVQMAAGHLSDTATSNETAISSLSEEAVQQANDIAAALDRLQAMTDAIREVALNAEQAESAVQMATNTVETGEEAMNRTVDGIMAIRETVAETAKKVKRLGESSQKISKVVNLIGSFADQTNLLALNASIEAAHAGEEGRGFAVVADEVRSLARQSAAATAEIEALVASIQSETNEVVAAMEAGTEQVVMGTKLVDETRKSLNQITAASIQISELVEAIAQTAVQQADTSQDVTLTMAQVAAISDKTSSEAAQVSESFRQLLKVAQVLQESVRQFKVK